MTIKYSENNVTFKFANDTAWYPLPPFEYEQDGKAASKTHKCLSNGCEVTRKETKSPKYGTMIDGTLRLRFCQKHQSKLNSHRSAWFKSDAFQLRKAEIEVAKAQAKITKLNEQSERRVRDTATLKASLAKMNKGELIAQILAH